MRNFFQKLFDMLKHNWGLKLASAIFAILLWSFVISETNPYYNITVKNVPLRVENVQSVDDKGYAIVGGLDSLQDSVDVTVEVRRNEYSKVTVDTVTATIDLATISGTGQQQVKAALTTQYGTIKNADVMIDVTVDDKITREIPVSYLLSGDKSDEYYYGVPSLSAETIQVAGARVDIEKAETGVCVIDISSETASFKKSMNVAVYDAVGSPIQNLTFQGDIPSVIVEMEILPKKTVPINGLASIKGTELLNEGYEVTGVSTTPGEVEIAAPQAVLDGIQEVYLEPIEINRASTNFTVTAQIKEMEGVKILKSSEVTAEVYIEEVRVEKSFTGVSIEAVNKGAGLKAQLNPSRTDVELTGKKSAVSALAKKDIRLYVDLNGLTAGTHTVPVAFYPMSGIDNEDVKVLSAEVTVTLK